MYHALEVALADLARVEAELGEAPLGAGVVHHARQHVEVALCVARRCAALQEVAYFEDMDRSLVTRARQILALDVERQIANLRRCGAAPQLPQLTSVLRIKYSDQCSLRNKQAKTVKISKFI